MEGWVKFHRKILDWEWFRDVNTCHLFMYCIVRANCKPSRFMGVEIQRGQFATSYPSISADTGLSIRQTRTALDHLKSTGELTVKTYPKFSVITVVSYEQYQCDRQASDRQVTVNRQSIDSQSTGERQQYKNIRNKEYKNERIQEDIQGDKSPCDPPVPSKRFVKPSVEEVREYIQSKGYTFSAESFMAYYNGNGWKVGRTAMKSWKDTCDSWHYRRKDDKVNTAQLPKKVNAQQYEQRTNDLDGAFCQFTKEELEEMMRDDS